MTTPSAARNEQASSKLADSAARANAGAGATASDESKRKEESLLKADKPAERRDRAAPRALEERVTVTSQTAPAPPVAPPAAAAPALGRLGAQVALPSDVQITSTSSPSSDVSWFVGRAGACKLPYRDGIFHVVLAVECIFHFASRLKFFREVRRVLAPGGRLALSDFVPRAFAAPWLGPWLLCYARDISRFYGWMNYFSPSTVSGYRMLARLTGFRLTVNDDITRNTLPTYPALLRVFREIDHPIAACATGSWPGSAEPGWSAIGVSSSKRSEK